VKAKEKAKKVYSFFEEEKEEEKKVGKPTTK